MKLIPITLTLIMLAVSEWAEEAEPEPYSLELVKMAEAGDAKAQCSLGSCYWWGQGINKDCEEVFKWST